MPSATAHTAVVRAATAHCVAVIGSACVGSRAIIFSVNQKDVPKPTACREGVHHCEEGVNHCEEGRAEAHRLQGGVEPL